MLVTGGAGFIGVNFLQYVLKHHVAERVVCYDALTYAGHIESIEDALKGMEDVAVPESKRFRFVKGDVADKTAVFAAFEEEHPEVVVHFAAESHVDRSITGPEVFLTTNVLGTGVLLEAARQFGVRRYHQVSTDEVYGDLPLDRPDLKFTEESPIHTSSPYSASKASADLLVLAYFRTYGLPVTISRCSNNYGPYQHCEKLIPLMITHALDHKPLPVYGTGENVRDWLYVEDHCSAILSIIEKGVCGEVYNVGDNNERSNLTVIRRILKELGKDESLISFVEDRLGHDRRYAIDAAKLRQATGWEPKTCFEEGLAETVRWYLEHEDWRFQ
ncbi:MAG: dTDP-glucose 4,6-dehydratase [Lachnospiraceae bacterium]